MTISLECKKKAWREITRVDDVALVERRREELRKTDCSSVVKMKVAAFRKAKKNGGGTDSQQHPTTDIP